MDLGHLTHRGALARAAAFFLFASAYWAMLPLVAREVLAGGPALCGVLLGCVGEGAVAGALVLPAIRRRLGPDRTVAAGTLGTAAAVAAFATVAEPIVAGLASLLAGFSWIAVLSSLNVPAQTALPDWVRARGLSVFLTVFFGSMAAGSLAWGQVAANLSVPTALLIAAAGAVAAIPLAWRFRLNRSEELDLAPSMHWPAPMTADEPEPERGPVMIQLCYYVPPAKAETFSELMRELGQARRRAGGYGWTLMRDAAHPERFVETWFELSWAQHLRHHERVSGDDRLLQERIRALHRAEVPPRYVISSRHPPRGDGSRREAVQELDGRTS